LGFVGFFAFGLLGVFALLGLFELVLDLVFFEVEVFAVDLAFPVFDVFLVSFGGTWIRLTIHIQLMVLRIDKISVLSREQFKTLNLQSNDLSTGYLAEVDYVQKDLVPFRISYTDGFLAHKRRLH
jgi:hypothetical protein